MAPPVVPNFQINTVLMPSPSDYQWHSPEILGYNGAGKPRYAPYYSITLTWNYMSVDDFSKVMRAYEINTGIVHVNLPTVWGNETNPYRYVTYYAVNLDRPIIEGVDTQNYKSNIKMTIRKLSVVDGGSV